MENKTFYNEILTEHNLHPYHKHKLEDANLVLEGVNPSCGDDIFLELKVEDGVVVDGAFEGDGCAISQASADMMLELVIGRSHRPDQGIIIYHKMCDRRYFFSLIKYSIIIHMIAFFHKAMAGLSICIIGNPILIV